MTTNETTTTRRERTAPAGPRTSPAAAPCRRGAGGGRAARGRLRRRRRHRELGDHESDEPAAESASTGTDGYCDAALAIETAGEPEIDFESATEEEIAADHEGMGRGHDAAVGRRPVGRGARRGATEPGRPVRRPRRGGRNRRLHRVRDPRGGGRVRDDATPTTSTRAGGRRWPSTRPTTPSPACPTRWTPASSASSSRTAAPRSTRWCSCARTTASPRPSTSSSPCPRRRRWRRSRWSAWPGRSRPASASTAVVDLEAGEYVAICFIPVGTVSFDGPPPEGPPHMMQGMVARAHGHLIRPERATAGAHSAVGPVNRGARFSRWEARPSRGVGPAEAEELVGQRGVEDRPTAPGTSGSASASSSGSPTGRRSASVHGHLERPVLHLVVVDAQRHEPDALGLLAGERVAREQVVLGLGHAAQQRPADRGVVAGGDAEAGVAVDDAGGAADDRDVGEERRPPARRRPPGRGWPTRSASSS